MTIQEMVSSMTLEEKAKFLTGAASMLTHGLDRLGIEPKKLADASHGIRLAQKDNCTYFPNLCCLAATWDKDIAKEMGEGLSRECIRQNVSLLLGPGVNIKKNILCGRNFEYLSEDPVLAGELCAAFINGLEENGVGTSLKHFAVNNQEKYRTETSVEIDERTLREIYLKPFEIAVKKSKPASVMCAYNKVNAIWCSENKFLLTEILKEEWGYEGFVVSDWGAVHDVCRVINAGLDFQMPGNPNILAALEAGLAEGRTTMEAIDKAVARVLTFVTRDKPVQKEPYDRDTQHALARRIAASGITLLKNENGVLPITAKKYKKIGVLGGFAEDPLIGGEGAADVYPMPEYIESPLAELKKLMPDVEFVYRPVFTKNVMPEHHLWGPEAAAANKLVADCDAVIFFMGAMLSEDTERYDRRSARMNENFEDMIFNIRKGDKKFIGVLQAGSPLLMDDWMDRLDAAVYAWFGGEATGGAIADILTGKVNPSSKLPETLPTCMRTDFEYPGTRMHVEYNDKLNVGYRYYDQHPEQIGYPFGHGLSYTTFAYSDASVELNGDTIDVRFALENTGSCDGSEVVQIYVGDPVSVVTKPPKELKAFEKVFLNAGEKKTVHIQIPVSEIAYYNMSLHDWVVEDGVYDVHIAASSRDIRLTGSIVYEGNMPYTMVRQQRDMVG